MRRLLPPKSGPRRMMVAVMLGALAGAPARAATASPVSTEATPTDRVLADIARYCQTCWRNAGLRPDSWSDCTQEVFVRLLERVDVSRWPGVLTDDDSVERKEFLRAIDAIKKRSQRARQWSALPTDLPERSPANSQTWTDERDAWAQAAARLLSPRQRQLLDLTAEGWTVAEIAGELNTTPERVSDEKYKAIKKLQRYFEA